MAMLFIKDDLPDTEGLHYQCRLEQRQERDGLWVIIAWLKADGALKGQHLKLKGEEGWWTVTEVYTPPQTIEWLREKQAHDRRSLPSIKG